MPNPSGTARASSLLCMVGVVQILMAGTLLLPEVIYIGMAHKSNTTVTSSSTTKMSYDHDRLGFSVLYALSGIVAVVVSRNIGKFYRPVDVVLANQMVVMFIVLMRAAAALWMWVSACYAHHAHDIDTIHLKLATDSATSCCHEVFVFVLSIMVVQLARRNVQDVGQQAVIDVDGNAGSPFARYFRQRAEECPDPIPHGLPMPPPAYEQAILFAGPDSSVAIAQHREALVGVEQRSASQQPSLPESSRPRHINVTTSRAMDTAGSSGYALPPCPLSKAQAPFGENKAASPQGRPTEMAMEASSSRVGYV